MVGNNLPDTRPWRASIPATDPSEEATIGRTQRKGVRLVRGVAGGTGVTGALYEPGERAPTYRGAPDTDAPYVRICDSFYAVESGGQRLELDDGMIRAGVAGGRAGHDHRDARRGESTPSRDGNNREGAGAT